MSSNSNQVDKFRLGNEQFWKADIEDQQPSAKIVFDNSIEFSGIKIRGNADRIRISYKTDDLESFVSVQVDEFKRLPAEMSGVSKITFSRISNVKEVLIEFQSSFVFEQLTAQLELLGCAGCKYFFSKKFFHLKLFKL